MEPTTEAGRALLDDWPFRDTREARRRILAIEQQAAAAATPAPAPADLRLDEERLALALHERNIHGVTQYASWVAYARDILAALGSPGVEDGQP